MRKQEFLDELKKKLSDLPKNEAEERVSFYSEMIDDMVDEGLAEDEAIARLCTTENIQNREMATAESEKTKRRPRTWEIVLLALGSPIWISLLAAALAVVIALYASVWAVIISLWSCFVSLAVSAPCAIAAGIIFICRGDIIPGIAIMSTSLVCAGLAIFAFYGCKAVTKYVIILTKKCAARCKNLITKKEAKNA